MEEFTKISVDRIRVGTVFSDAVYFEDGKNMFLPQNKPARQYHVDVIKQWKVPYLLTNGKEVSDTAEK